MVSHFPNPHRCIKLPFLQTVHCLHDKHTPCITLLDLYCSSVRASAHPTSSPAPWNHLDDSAWWPQQAVSTNIAVQRISPHQWSITFSFSSCSAHSWKPAGKSHHGGKRTILAERHHPHLKRTDWRGRGSCPETGCSFCCTARMEKCFNVCVLSGSSLKRRTFLWKFSWDNWLPVSCQCGGCACKKRLHGQCSPLPHCLWFAKTLWIHRTLFCIWPSQPFPKWEPAPQRIAMNPIYSFLPLLQGCPPVSVEHGCFCLSFFLDCVKHLKPQPQKSEFQPNWQKICHFSDYVSCGKRHSTKSVLLRGLAGAKPYIGGTCYCQECRYPISPAYPINLNSL